MKKIMAAILLLAGFAISSCSSLDSPTAVVKSFYTYLGEGKVNDAFDLITEGGQKMLQKFGGVSMLSNGTDKMKRKGGIKGISPLSESITGETAKVSIKLTYGNDSTDKKTENLIKEQGTWRIVLKK